MIEIMMIENNSKADSETAMLKANQGNYDYIVEKAYQ